MKKLQTHLAYYVRTGLMDVWDDTKLLPGAVWHEEIKNALRQTKVAILLVSADFLASKFIAENELPPLLAAAQTEGAIIVPVILSACAFEETELTQFQAVNSPSMPVAKMKIYQREELWAKIAKDIKKEIIMSYKEPIRTMESLIFLKGIRPSVPHQSIIGSRNAEPPEWLLALDKTSKPNISQIHNNGSASIHRKRISASLVRETLRQAQTFQTQGRLPDAIDLCEQILESGFDRPDVRYFLGWLYQERRRWADAIQQFRTLLNDPDYAPSSYYALGQCYRDKGNLHTAAKYFDVALDSIDVDALTKQESDKLVQLCQETAEAHRLLGEQGQATIIYQALLGFFRSRGWGDLVILAEFMLKQVQNTPLPPSQKK